MTETCHPEAIVDGDWLEAHLADPDLRIYDCTTYLRYEEGRGRPYRVESGRADWEAGLIPGTMHLDLQAELSVDDAPTRFMRRSPEGCAASFARHGVAEGTRVILYSRKSPQWATRFWWMLRWIGFDDAAVLDGGMDRWEAEGRPVWSKDTQYLNFALWPLALGEPSSFAESMFHFRIRAESMAAHDLIGRWRRCCAALRDKGCSLRMRT